MRQRKREELAIYELKDEADVIRFEAIRNLLVNKTSDIIYLTLNGKLYGILCLGDFLHHMKNGEVPIVKNFVKINGFKGETARDIFAARKNIHKIPIVSNGDLLGDYSRWDDTNRSLLKWLFRQNAVWEQLKRYIKANKLKKVFVVNPVKEKVWIKNSVMMLMANANIDVILLEKENLHDLIYEMEKCLIILTDADEWRGIICIDEIDYGTINDNLNWFTFFELYKELIRYDKNERLSHYSIVSEGKGIDSFKKLQENGVKIVAFYNDIYYISSYIKAMVRKQADVAKMVGLKEGEFWSIETEIGKKYFGELLEKKDYISGTAQKEMLYGHSLHKVGSDCAGKYYNVICGYRKTCYQPESYCGTIYLFGLCLIMGAYLEDQYTIASQLQKILCENGYYYRVENRGTYNNVFEEVQKVGFCAGDIAIIWTGENTYEGIESIELRRTYELNNVPAEWCLGSFTHINNKVAQIIADTFFKRVESYLCHKQNDVKNGNDKRIFFEIQDYNDILGNYIQKMYLQRNFEELLTWGGGIIGCMLVDLYVKPAIYSHILPTISARVDYLIIFVPDTGEDAKYTLEEYISEFSEIVLKDNKAGVFLGDGFVPYYNFFPTYYLSQQLSVDQAKIDARVFSQCIAKPLNIKYRFAYVDNTQEKTIQYSRVLKKELPKYGIDYIEVL